MNRGISSVQRTMRELRVRGDICTVVEKFNPHVGPHGIRQDLFGIVDVLVLDPERGFVGIQCCGQAFSAHWKKLTEDQTCIDACIHWLQTPGGHLEIWSWRKVKLQRGGKAERWQPRIVPITLETFAATHEGGTEGTDHSDTVERDSEEASDANL